MTKIFKNNEIVEMTAEEQTIFDESKVAIQEEETRVNNERMRANGKKYIRSNI